MGTPVGNLLNLVLMSLIAICLSALYIALRQVARTLAEPSRVSAQMITATHKHSQRKAIN